jgi:transcriptional regulator with XRE-family HTH domain
MKAFAARVQGLREKRGLSQGELARLLKIHVTQVSKYERGLALPSAETIVSMARLLEVSSDELLAGDGSKTPEAPEIRHLTLFDRFKKLDREIDDPKDMEAILALMDAFIAKKQFKRLAAST